MDQADERTIPRATLGALFSGIAAALGMGRAAAAELEPGEPAILGYTGGAGPDAPPLPAGGSTQTERPPAAPATTGVTLTQAEYAALQRDAQRAQAADAERVRVEAELAQREAAAQVEALVGTGRILPAQREAALELYHAQPDLFARLYGAAQPQIDLTQRGLSLPAGLAGEGGPGGASAAVDGFIGTCERFHAQHPEMAFVDVMELVARDQPELYHAYRKESR